MKFTEHAWTKFCEAALQRQDIIYEKLKPYIDNELPLPVHPSDIYRHEMCYKVYILKKSVQLAEKKRKASAATNNSTDLNPAKRMTRAASVSHVTKTTCIICREVYKKDPKDRRRSVEAVPFTLFSAVESLQEAAKIRGDHYILNQLAGGARGGRDAIAGDVHKHEDCYKAYTNPNTLSRLQSDDVYTRVSDTKPFKDLTSLIQNTVIEGGTVWTMATVRELYTAALLKHGVSRGAKFKRLKSHPQRHFGDRLCFHRPVCQNESELIYSNTVDIGPVLQGYKDMENKLVNEDIESDLQFSPTHDENPMKEAYRLALQVHETLRQTKNMVWPPTPEFCTADHVQSLIPPLLHNLIAWIILQYADFSEQPVELDEVIKAKVLSICQDIIFASRCGRVLTPKHVSLAMAVRRVTGSTELITILNKFGHTVSSSKLQEIEAAVGELRQHEGSGQVPANIVKHVPVMFVFDNNDFSEETPSGKNTSHCTNGIIIQPRTHGCNASSNHVNVAPGPSHRRSITNHEKQLLQYPKAPRCPPQRRVGAVELFQTPVASEFFTARNQDLAWFLSRLHPDLTLPAADYFQVNELYIYIYA